MQLINIYYGGTLYQDLDNHMEDVHYHDVLDFPKWYPVHKVKLEKESHLAKAFKKLEIETNSIHHQIIKEVGDGLEIIARTSDGIIEGIEDRNKLFLAGVQWHPEMMFEEVKEQKELFDYFIEQVRGE
ncbi:gamma-glutamyl-gamma-aminobutyrate hydrolase PuuD [Sporohalobacter salinus]|nr:gamma-glutamyl-gamma-aminobutyrate hydrolase PuuD [Sporohalobacter salinus]